jgi:hypothetical protein
LALHLPIYLSFVSLGRGEITPGLAVKAMIINGLGMFSAPLYLFEKFFEGKATEHLLGVDVTQCQAARFIWATNCLDSTILFNTDVLREYKVYPV